MRRLPMLVLSLLLVASGAAIAQQTLPRGTEGFQLAMSRAAADSAIAARGATVISISSANLVCRGEAPQVEFERYDFSASAADSGFLWRVTVGYRVPYHRADFDSVREVLSALLGEPAQVESPPLSDLGATHRVTWVDRQTLVELAARWPKRPDPRADRMIITWTDRRLQKMVSAQQRPKKRSR